MSEYEIEFWKDYLHADHIERLELIKKLPIRKMLRDMEAIKDQKITEEMKTQMIAQLLNGYFDDLVSAVYTKFENEKKAKLDVK